MTLVIRERQNVLTGEWVPLDPPAIIDADDLDWLQRLWLEGDELDYELMRSAAIARPS